MAILTSAANFLVNLPSQLMGSVTSAANTLANSVTNLGTPLVGGLPSPGQYFFTVPFPNNQTVLYKLELISDTNTSTPTSAASSPQNNPVFVFPLTPNNISYQVINLSSYYDVRGDPTKFGVLRIIDQFGLTPPIITISGTTGFQYHSLDGYQWSGKQSFNRLILMIQQYGFYVSQAAGSTQPTSMPILRFTDGFTAETYDVIPLGSQAYTMESSRPILRNYNIQFLAKQSVISQAISLSQEDPVTQALVTSKALLTGGLLSISASLQSFIPGTITG